MRLALLLLATALLAKPALADALGCSGAQPDPSAEGLKLGTISVSKARFHDDALKATKAYVVKGDEVLVAADESSSQDWLCVSYIGKKGAETIGFLKAGEVTLRDIEPLPAEQWYGDWTTGKWQNVTVKPGKTPGWLSIDGSAYWAMSDEAAEAGGINIGSLYGEAPLEGGRFGFTMTADESYKPYTEEARDAYECAALVQLLSRNYLMIWDSGSCGGHNVRFTGIYGRGKVDDLEGS